MGAALALLALTACGSSDDPRLLNLAKSGRGPDEFAVLPTKPLQAPEDFAALPPPTPGGANLVDPTPEADMVAALGGNPAALARPGVDGGVVNYAGRYGIAPDIRPALAAEDLELRRRNDGRLLERIFNVNVYYRAYRRQDMELDQYRELDRFRRAGVRTPAVPPQAVAEGR
jgi:hypothetical protein